MKRLRWFKCRNDDDFQTFLGDLQRATEFFVDGNEMQITMTTDSGIMHFRRR